MFSLVVTIDSKEKKVLLDPQVVSRGFIYMKDSEELTKYCKLDSQAISLVYGYLQKKKRLEITYDTSKVQVSDYVYLHTEKSRSAFIAIRWDGEKQFILPPAVDLLMLDDGKVNRYISMSEIMMKAEKNSLDSNENTID